MEEVSATALLALVKYEVSFSCVFHKMGIFFFLPKYSRKNVIILLKNKKKKEKKPINNFALAPQCLDIIFIP